MKITRKNFWPKGVALPPVILLDAFKKMLAHLQSGKPVKYMCRTIRNLVDESTANEFKTYITEEYLLPNAGTNNFYNFYNALYLKENDGEYFGDRPIEQVTELRIEWLKAAIANIEFRIKPRVKRAVKLSDTKVYKTLKKGLADDPSEFQKVYVGLKWAWDNYPAYMELTRKIEFNKNLSYIAYWSQIPVENWDYWRALSDKFFPNWESNQ
jgi:hypothetical protein